MTRRKAGRIGICSFGAAQNNGCKRPPAPQPLDALNELDNYGRTVGVDFLVPGTNGTALIDGGLCACAMQHYCTSLLGPRMRYLACPHLAAAVNRRHTQHVFAASAGPGELCLTAHRSLPVNSHNW